ncbi:sugar-transfer associated ATP-grasp domain-containing protein [Faecalibacterium prausnitzii]|uniref:sugar-transfer associated ATP-grasp domain-containing protein n=1 Tax=Faecalibacterium prausnitzii TaxID=853 RepID=UPI00290DFAD5|nr:sugar-transfer associated ATP-grasp domain-containing protein [Faecalibacterium prausnitzii]MDU8724169.1 sugar-transfer associated ATP-grasp domain-containing protein [Faecalibacterium prausnitzii]
MNKKKIKQFLLGQLDNLEHINAVIGEKKKFRDKRRVEICNSTKLSQEQIDSVEKLYKNNYGKKIPLTWHKSYTAYTGRFDKYYFPEILYIPEFERYMNYNQSLANVLEDKNLLYVFAKASNVRMPRMYLSCQAGIYKDAENKVLDFEKACALISNIGVCFAKPSIGTDSGRGCEVYCLVNGTDTKSGKTSGMLLKDLGKNFTIQERLVCHESIRKIYDGSVNTFRIMTYRWKNQIIVAPIIMRIGRGGSYLDNAHAGGMFIALSDDGTLHKTAFTEFKEEFVEHPDSKLKFEGYRIPLLPNVVDAVKRMHYSLPAIGVINWDMTLDESGQPVLIEANVNGGSIWLFQMAHGCGVFGERTPEILRWLHKMNETKYSDRAQYYFGE